MPGVVYQDFVELKSQKQDKIALVKTGLFTPGEGQDGDMGVCQYQGKYYFAIKSLGDWFFAEALRATQLSRNKHFIVKG
jgi:hypothetical protein